MPPRLIEATKPDALTNLRPLKELILISPKLMLCEVAAITTEPKSDSQTLPNKQTNKLCNKEEKASLTDKTDILYDGRFGNTVM